jgi:cytochrome c oxidase cbb3-type subunit 1
MEQLRTALPDSFSGCRNRGMTKGRSMLDYLKLVILGVVVVCAAIAANYARDAAYLVHMLLFMAAGGGLFLYTLRRMGEPAAPVPTHEYMDGPVRAAAIATAFWGVVGFLAASSSPSSWPFRS